ncbi:hypothetical protein PC116_g23707 [Phytophthora cactorum]|uniref:Uncharacterized protein n=1 Tax=Phytophthora cactorum TaxID=29920 RepID=A0A8T1JS22_9STRA|nr:hypothetical protein PC117_g23700 [Phytophthora cactorum]KAG2961551.1 hypothetical protein PC119_g26075 [Phytophthora cactorum]KAG3131183.1 hypothetical protein C6341_g23433 [Phytophthora cactorum]KAG3158022.1 hypothetical protein PC128_g21569 [Phytophthora cactorum]KAG4227924.1 hypothetical protein PC116_g23707 [Phytophthora cactorum]
MFFIRLHRRHERASSVLQYLVHTGLSRDSLNTGLLAFQALSTNPSEALECARAGPQFRRCEEAQADRYTTTTELEVATFEGASIRTATLGASRRCFAVKRATFEDKRGLVFYRTWLSVLPKRCTIR